MEKQEKSLFSFLNTATARFILVGILTLLLLIPLEFVRQLISERKHRQQEVIAEVNDKWGEEVIIYGPILKVPYKIYSETIIVDQNNETTKQRNSTTKYAYFFPETLSNSIEVNTKPLKRGNYQSIVYSGGVTCDGNYLHPDFSDINTQDNAIEWEKATLLIRTTNLKNITKEVQINLNGKSYTLESQYSDDNYGNMQTLSSGYLDSSLFSSKKPKDFSFSIQYNGSKSIRLVPIGKTTDVHLTSNWHSPSFTGEFLPNDETKEISESGFSADWKILNLNRPFGQSFFENLPDLMEYSFGVDFIIPNDEYQQNERTAKYGLMVISLTFLVFFMIQAINKIHVHIVQYVMIGIALVLFYTLLLSISEHSSFNFAYLIAATGIITMISLYSITVLKVKRFALFVGSSLTCIYTFIFIIIQMENYALLAGSIGLFIILALVMYFSRKIDWANN